jgi:hypothetical protein
MDSAKTQLELGILRTRERDRNHHLGGRSFYFFDFDDNIAHLATPLVIFDKKTNEERLLTSQEWALYHSQIGKPGPYENYFLDYDDRVGSFRYFRDQTQEDLIKLGLSRQFFIDDVLKVLLLPDFQWKGPSWDCFYHATFNQRPISVITARGHGEETLKAGIKILVDQKILPMEPNYLSLFPVSRLDVRRQLGDHDLLFSAAELKQRAIRASVERAFEVFGYNPHHRFGMSDDDPKNIQLIYEEMKRLKKDYPEISFFLIETHQGGFVKHEIHESGHQAFTGDSLVQMSFFDSSSLA